MSNQGLNSCEAPSIGLDGAEEDEWPGQVPVVVALGTLRERRFPAGAYCPRCGARELMRWGHFSGRQRYRCRACHRTSSDFTGTPMYYSKLVPLWPRFAECLIEQLSVRAVAARLGMDKDTAWRWRHRVLRACARGAPRSLRGSVETLEQWLPVLRPEGQADPGRYRGRPRARLVGESVLIARDQEHGVASRVVGRRGANPRDYEALLASRAPKLTVLIAPAARLAAAARFASAYEIALRRHSTYWPPESPYRPDPYIHVRSYARHLRNWMRRFRGIGTGYLSSYIQWHQLLFDFDSPQHRLLFDAQRAPPESWTDSPA